MYKYSDVYMRLQFDTAIVTFKKKDNTVRVMLCTRNAKTAVLVMKDINMVLGYLSGHDKRCGIHNGNLAVYDLAICECRAFNIDRVLDIKYLGTIMTEDEIDEAFRQMREYENSIKDIYNAEDNFEQLIALERSRIERQIDESKNKEVNGMSVGAIGCNKPSFAMQALRSLIDRDREVSAAVENEMREITANSDGGTTKNGEV